MPVSFHAAVNGCNHNISSDVEFSFLIQKRNDVLLDDVGSRLAFFTLSLFLYYTVYLFKSFNHNDSVSSIGVFSWFDKPGISPFGFKSILYLIISDIFLIFFLFFYLLISFYVLFQKIVKLLISFLFYMKCHWDIYKRILFSALIVSL